MIINVFEACSPGFMPPGMWQNPEDESFNYLKIEHWSKLAKLLERGRFDGIFLADILGNLDIYGGGLAAALTSGMVTPCNDPLMIIPSMAQVTEHLGFGVTASLSYEPPYLFARKMSTLDHLTNGRIGWNVVTSYLDSAARALGLDRQLPHEERYRVAEEYMELMYKLWEGSWEDDAVIRDRTSGVYAKPELVHPVVHHGKYFKLEAIHRCEPSPQRTPIIYQAGSSSKGRGFAAHHGECIFVDTSSIEKTRGVAEDIRRQASELGRDQDSLRIIGGIMVIVGETEADAQAQLEKHRKFLLPGGTLAMMSAAMGFDLAAQDPDSPIGAISSEGNLSAVRVLTDSENAFTPRAVGNHLQGGHGAVIVGTPSSVADEMERWIEEASLDGFNLSQGFRFDTMERFVDLAVPELQRRGVMQREYRPGTMREKIFGKSARLPASHPADNYRIKRD
jgi:FMN-dependent oxidoreductase (nitrilotriacetate monooxygenase family)